MAHIYIAFVNTPGFFASILHRVLKEKYIHVVLSMDSNLEEAYSFGRRNPFIPVISGFEREEKEKIVKAFPGADYMICELDCTEEQKSFLREDIEKKWNRRFRYHYAVLGLPFVPMNIPFYQKNHYTCSSYLARILEEAGIIRQEKHFSLVTPVDFYQYQEKRVIFEGKLMELIKKEEKQTMKVKRLETAYE